MSAPGQRSFGDLLRFYLPLVATSQMMTLSNPLLNYHLSRAPDPTQPLAGYSVAFGSCILLYAPLLTLPNVGAALLSGRATLRRLSLLVLLAGSAISLLELAIAWTALGDWLYGGLLHASERVSASARAATLALAPLPILVGWRGLRSALVLRSRRTTLLSQATALRIGAIVLVLLIAQRLARFEAATAGLALSCGIFCETLWLHLRTRGHARALPQEAEPIDWSRIARFALPLAASAYAWSALRPLINGILGRSADGEAAQASFGVLHPLLLLCGSALWALQSTGQIHADGRASARRFLGFAAVAIAVAAGLVLALGWVPPLRSWLLGTVFPLPPELLDYVRPAMQVLFLAPIFLGLRAAFKGMILASGGTGIVLVAAVSYLALAAAAGAAALHWLPGFNGALLGVLLVTLVEATEATILGTVASHRILRPKRAPNV